MKRGARGVLRSALKKRKGVRGENHVIEIDTPAKGENEDEPRLEPDAQDAWAEYDPFGLLLPRVVSREWDTLLGQERESILDLLSSHFDHAIARGEPADRLGCAWLEMLPQPLVEGGLVLLPDTRTLLTTWAEWVDPAEYREAVADVSGEGLGVWFVRSRLRSSLVVAMARAERIEEFSCLVLPVYVPARLGQPGLDVLLRADGFLESVFASNDSGIPCRVYDTICRMGKTWAPVRALFLSRWADYVCASGNDFVWDSVLGKKDSQETTHGATPPGLRDLISVVSNAIKSHASLSDAVVSSLSPSQAGRLLNLTVGQGPGLVSLLNRIPKAMIDDVLSRHVSPSTLDRMSALVLDRSTSGSLAPAPFCHLLFRQILGQSKTPEGEALGQGKPHRLMCDYWREWAEAGGFEDTSRTLLFKVTDTLARMLWDRTVRAKLMQDQGQEYARVLAGGIRILDILVDRARSSSALSVSSLLSDARALSDLGAWAQGWQSGHYSSSSSSSSSSSAPLPLTTLLCDVFLVIVSMSRQVPGVWESAPFVMRILDWMTGALPGSSRRVGAEGVVDGLLAKWLHSVASKETPFARAREGGGRLLQTLLRRLRKRVGTSSSSRKRDAAEDKGVVKARRQRLMDPNAPTCVFAVAESAFVLCTRSTHDVWVDVLKGPLTRVLMPWPPWLRPTGPALEAYGRRLSSTLQNLAYGLGEVTGDERLRSLQVIARVCELLTAFVDARDARVWMLQEAEPVSSLLHLLGVTLWNLEGDTLEAFDAARANGANCLYRYLVSVVTDQERSTSGWNTMVALAQAHCLIPILLGSGLKVLLSKEAPHPVAEHAVAILAAMVAVPELARILHQPASGLVGHLRKMLFVPETAYILLGEPDTCGDIVKLLRNAASSPALAPIVLSERVHVLLAERLAHLRNREQLGKFVNTLSVHAPQLAVDVGDLEVVKSLAMTANPSSVLVRTLSGIGCLR